MTGRCLTKAAQLLSKAVSRSTSLDQFVNLHERNDEPTLDSLAGEQRRNQPFQQFLPFRLKSRSRYEGMITGTKRDVWVVGFLKL